METTGPSLIRPLRVSTFWTAAHVLIVSGAANVAVALVATLIEFDMDLGPLVLAVPAIAAAGAYAIGHLQQARMRVRIALALSFLFLTLAMLMSLEFVTDWHVYHALLGGREPPGIERTMAWWIQYFLLLPASCIAEAAVVGILFFLLCGPVDPQKLLMTCLLLIAMLPAAKVWYWFSHDRSWLFPFDLCSMVLWHPRLEQFPVTTTSVSLISIVSCIAAILLIRSAVEK